jgi:hypothetical protein
MSPGGCSEGSFDCVNSVARGAHVWGFQEMFHTSVQILREMCSS